MSTNLFIILICNNIYASLSLSLLPFSFLNPPLLLVIIYRYVSQVFYCSFSFFIQFIPCLISNFTRLCPSPFLLVIFLFLFSLSHLPLLFLHPIPFHFFLYVVTPRHLIFFCSVIYFSSSTSFKYYQFVLFFMSKEFFI